MKAIGFTRHGGPEVLEFVEVPEPVAGPRDVVVGVRAAGVNPVDAKVRRGLRGRPPEGGPTIVGWDAAGVVESVGPEVRRFRPGDAVWFAGDIGRPGSYARKVAVDERIVGPGPRSLSLATAAAIPLVAITAWESLVENLGIGEGQGVGKSILVVGGAGGVGSIAIQIAKRVCGLFVVATAGRPESIEACRRLGADLVLDHGRDLAAQLAEAGRPEVDFVHTNAVPDFPALAAVLRPLGRIAAILPATGADLSSLFAKRASIHFEFMFARPMHGAEPERQGALLARVADLFDRGTLEPPPIEVLDWSRFREAHERIETEHTIGKIVLAVT